MCVTLLVMVELVAFEPKLVFCAKCNVGIFSAYPGQYVSCPCGAISVDQTEHYSRYIGDPENFKEKPNNNDSL